MGAGLTICSNCKAFVRESSRLCRYCGYPIRRRFFGRTGVERFATLIVLLLLLLIVILLYSGGCSAGL